MTEAAQARLLRLIAEEDYARFDEQMKRLASEAAESSDPAVIDEFRRFAELALVAVKARRAHYELELQQTAELLRFVALRDLSATVDLVG